MTREEFTAMTTAASVLIGHLAKDSPAIPEIYMDGINTTDYERATIEIWIDGVEWEIDRTKKMKEDNNGDTVRAD